MKYNLLSQIIKIIHEREQHTHTHTHTHTQTHTHTHTQALNQIKKRPGMDYILKEEKGQWWERTFDV